MDYRNNGNGGDRNIILMAHMKDGSMFQDLMSIDSELQGSWDPVQYPI